MSSLKEVTENIKSMKVQGAKQIAIYSLKFLKKFCKKYGFGKKFEIVCEKLEKIRPTAVVLHNCLKILKNERNFKTIDRLLKELNKSTEKIAKIGAKLIKNNYRIMTHCHSGEALAIIKQAWKEGKKISVIATETDPLEQGVKTAKELAKLRIPVTLITDSAVGYFMPSVNLVLVGSDAIRKEAIINKTGTALLALAAKENKKPFYVVANSFKLDKREKIIIEERSPKEVYTELLKPGKLKGVKIRNPAFDLTKWKFVKAVVTEKGILIPKEILKLLK